MKETIELIEILINHFGSKNEVSVKNKLRELQEQIEKKETPFFDNIQQDVIDTSFFVGDIVRIQTEYQKRSRGIGNTKGKVTKINYKTVKVLFENKIWGVPKTILEKV